jgi:hypothetical protein
MSGPTTTTTASAIMKRKERDAKKEEDVSKKKVKRTVKSKEERDAKKKEKVIKVGIQSNQQRRLSLVISKSLTNHSLKLSSNNSWSAQQVNIYYYPSMIQEFRGIRSKSKSRSTEAKTNVTAGSIILISMHPTACMRYIKAVALELGGGVTIRSASNFRSSQKKAAYETQASYSTVAAPLTVPIVRIAPIVGYCNQSSYCSTNDR